MRAIRVLCAVVVATGVFLMSVCQQAPDNQPKIGALSKVGEGMETCDSKKGK